MFLPEQSLFSLLLYCHEREMVVSMESCPERERERDVGIVSPAKMAIGVDNLELVEGGVHDLVFGDQVLDHRDTEVANQTSQSQRHQLVHVPSYRSGINRISLSQQIKGKTVGKF